MSILSMIIIGLGLAMDAFAVSITSGITINNLHIKNALKISIFFGAFQAFMPVIGWLAGNSLYVYMQNYSHWIAFLLLISIGAKMIYEALKIEECELDRDCLNVVTLTMLSIATSIDALAVGISFSFLGVSIVLPIIIIGIITFVLSLIGVYIGNTLGQFFEKRFEIVGGLVIIFIGFKILLEKLFSGN